MHILLIEPDRLQARVMGISLKRAGHSMAHTTDAQAAIGLVDDHVPDVVILELLLPNHNGVEFLYEFRTYPEWLRIPILVHTFISLRELADLPTLHNELGVRKVLYKPTTTLAELQLAIQEVTPSYPSGRA
jgi:CheY-like chemotaxis protein